VVSPAEKAGVPAGTLLYVKVEEVPLAAQQHDPPANTLRLTFAPVPVKEVVDKLYAPQPFEPGDIDTS
jgi:hypothetical protein